MTILRDAQAEGVAYRRGRPRTMPRMYQPIWEKLYANPDKMHCIMVPLDQHERTKKALHKERWLHKAGSSTHKLVIRALNDQCLLASWTSYSGIKLQGSLDHLFEVGDGAVASMQEGSKFEQLRNELSAVLQRAMGAGKTKPSTQPTLGGH